MKISKIEIFDYHQFKNFSIDLTYPKGHAKEGLPLEKVCFIGQNGTGKTTLLNIIKELVAEAKYQTDNIKGRTPMGVEVLISKGKRIFQMSESYPLSKKNNILTYKVEFNNGEYILNTIERLNDESSDNEYIEQFDKNRSDFESYLSKRKTTLINIPSEMIDWDLSKQIDNPLKYLKPSNELEKEILIEKENLLKKEVFDFVKDNPVEIWKSILLDNSEYLLKELNFKSKIADSLLSENPKTDKIIEELKQWKAENPNPFLKISAKLNPILEKFNLKIKTNIDLKSPEDLYFIQLQSLTEHDIPMFGWSSGTKQIILTAAPLIKLDTWQTIILIDEPERSLYPDTQYSIVNFYRNAAPDAQLFIATHSPIIASSFEPWEIVELNFDEDGNVTQDLYYKGERHIDNYFIQPQYLRWDSLFYKLFDVKQDGDPHRKAKLFELTEKGIKLRQIKEQGNINLEEQRELWNEYKRIAEMLDWKIETA